MSKLILVGVVAVIAGIMFVGSRLRKRPLPACTACNRKDVVEIKREPKAIRPVVVHGHQTGGDTTHMQQELEITYQCNSCDHQFSRLVTETDF
ncbi:MAG: hypothetical protein GY943_28440 [Chloroflexi bacterium]|nr:hypothetical protein [Chloroflexota bacterium]